MIFSVGPPMGIGVAYIIGTVSKEVVSDDWRWAMRFTPIFLVAVLTLIVCAYKDPVRGKKAEPTAARPAAPEEKRGFIDDCQLLFKNKSYMLLVFTWAFGLSSYGK